jgi:hypothetical protein
MSAAARVEHDVHTAAVGQAPDLRLDIAVAVVDDVIDAHGAQGAVNPENKGTKAAAHYQMSFGAGETSVVRVQLAKKSAESKAIREKF